MENKTSLIKFFLFSFFIGIAPYFSSGQIRSITFDCEGLKLKLNKDEPSFFLNSFFHLQKGFSFKLVRTMPVSDISGMEHYTYQQYYLDYMIQNATIKIHCRNDYVYFINGEYLDTIDVGLLTVKINVVKAFETSKNAIGAKEYAWESSDKNVWLKSALGDQYLFNLPIKSSLVIFDNGSNRELNSRLTYKFEILAVNPFSHHFVFVDAQTGLIVGKIRKDASVLGTADTRFSGTRNIITSTNGVVFSLVDASRGGGITTKNVNNFSNPFTDNDNNWTAAEFNNTAKDDAALDAHWGMEMAYDYFNIVHGMNSFDNSGGAISSAIHFNSIFGIDDIRWLGGGALAFGDGTALPLTALDVVGHEYGHAINGASANLTAFREPGAISEGLSDIWAACIESYATNDKYTWTIGEDIVEGGFRSLEDPKGSSERPQPDTYGGTNWITTVDCGSEDDDDFCGIHTNGGLISFWFYLLSEGGTGVNDNSDNYSVSAIGINSAALITFRAETVYMTASTDYATARKLTIKAAQDIFGNCSPEVISTINGWHAVGVGPSYQTISNQTQTAPIFTGATTDLYSPGNLSASNTIQTGTNVSYTASVSVNLLPGFIASSGANFIAKIIPCKDLSAKKDLSNITLPVLKEIERNKDFSLKIFPNPSSDFITVSIAEYKNQFATVSILDINGKLIKTQQIFSTKTKIGIGELSAGIYLITVESSEINKTLKLIKK
jgi:Zn-dependent metalloprotease